MTPQTKNPFLDAVDQLAIWKFMPSGEARGALAVKLCEWCRGDARQAEWLVTQVDEFDEYPGPATLRKLITDKFRPAGPLASTPALVRSVADCAVCGDLGTRYDERQRTNVWCDCEQAQRVRVDTPGWLATVNLTRGNKQREEERAKRVAEALKQLDDGYGGKNE